jgi:hypothetical protein
VTSNGPTADPVGGFDENNRCIICGAHIADPCEPGCPAALLTTIKTDLELPDGTWPAVEVVDLLTDWFRGLGLDTNHVDAARPATGDAADGRVYRVTWATDIDTVGGPVAAARKARADQVRPGTTATVFDVEWTDTLGDQYGTEVTSRLQVDLNEPRVTADQAQALAELREYALVGDRVDPNWAEQERYIELQRRTHQLVKTVLPLLPAPPSER